MSRQGLTRRGPAAAAPRIARWGALLTLCAVAAGCAALRGPRAGVPPEYGAVRVYVQPFPQEAERLRFDVEQVWAEREDGSTVALSVELRQIEPEAVHRQRLLAADSGPPGAYRAVLFRVGRATLRTEEGDTALLVPEAPARLDQPFMVSRDRPALLLLTFQYRESIRGGIQFAPSFSPYVPIRPTTGLLGYVACPESRELTVFDKKSAQVVDLLAVGDSPSALAADPLKRRVYVAVAGQDAVDVIDMAAGEVLRRIPLNLGDAPRELHLAQEGRMLLVVNEGSDTVSFVDVESATEVARVNVGDGPSSLVIDRTGRKAVVLNTLASTASVLDLPSRSVAATFGTDAGPFAGQFNRRGDVLYVAHTGSPYLLVVDLPSLKVLKRVLVGVGVTALKTDPKTDLLYVSRSGEAFVSAYEPLSLTASDVLPVRGAAAHLAIDGEENALYLAQPEQRTVSVVNLNRRKVVSEIDVGAPPAWVTVMGER
ncbi:MAG: beta-propeller fold lactonase family protein [Deltaproteobacteria bacterium]|nr:beta-propeller fold lactonase family protein [Deltaproteobacteria bacterium]